MKKINSFRYILLMLCIGIVLSITIQLVKWIFNLLSIDVAPFVLGGGIVGAGMVFAIVITNKMIRSGHSKWLLKSETDK